MENVKAFNDELSAIVATKPPISRAKMTTLTKKAIKGIKYYKHVVQSIEKFIQKCRPEYKVPGLYVIDSVVRQSRHQFGVEREVFMPRLSKNIVSTFEHIYKCPVDDKPRIMRVLNLWQKNNVFPAEIVHQLMVMGGAPDSNNSNQNQASQQSQGENAKALTNVLNDLLTKPNTKGVEDLAKILTSAQRQQIQQLLEASSEAEAGNASVAAGSVAARQQHENNENRSSTGGPPMARGYPAGADRDVLDFDYDEKTPDDHHQTGHNRQQYGQVPHHPPPQQMQNAFNPGTAVTDPARLRRLEEEQKNFDQQLKQINVNEALSNVDMRLVSSLIKSTKRSRSRSRSRERKHRRHRSRDRDHRSSRRDRSRSPYGRSRRSRSRESDGGHRRHRPGMPPVKDGFISVCSKTVWVGNITAKVQPDELEEAIKSFGGTISNFNIIPPRGCAYIVMETRPEASNLLKNMKHLRLGGKNLKCDWGATKEIPNEYKETWVKEEGVYYIPYPDTIAKLEKLSDWGFVDPESIPDQLKATQQQVVEQRQEQPQVMLLAAPTAPNVAAAAAAAPPFGLPNLNPPPVTAQQQHRFVLNQPPPHQQLRHPITAPHHMQPIILHRQPLPPPFATTAAAAAPTANNNNNDQSTDMDIDGGGSPDGGGEIITTNSNHGDQDNRMQQQNFAPISLAQRFPGHPMPVIRMMPGSSMPPHRMNIMPLRMSIPMMRPGVHFPQRMAGGGPPHVLAANHIPHHHMQPPAGFPIRMQTMRPHMHPQQQERMPQQQEPPAIQLAPSRAAVAAIRPPNLMQHPPNNLPAASHLSADDEPERPSSSGISGEKLNDKFGSQQRKLEPPIVIDDRNPPSSPMKPPSRFDAAPPAATSFVPPSVLPSKTGPPRLLGIQHDHDARFGRSHPAPMLPASVTGRQAPVAPQEFGSASAAAPQSSVPAANTEPPSRFRRSENRSEDYDHRRSRDWDSRNRDGDSRRRDGDSRRSRDSWRSGDRSYRDDHSSSRSYRSSHDHHDRRDDRSSRYRNEESWRGSSPSRHRTRSPSSRRSDHRSSKRSSPSYERSRSDRDRRRDNSVDHDRRRRRHTPTYNSKSSSDHKRGDVAKEPTTAASTAAPPPGAWTVVEDTETDIIPPCVAKSSPPKDKDHRSSPREAPKPNLEVKNDDVKNSDEKPTPQGDDRDEGEIVDVDEENEIKSPDESAVPPPSPPAAIITKADDNLVIAEDDKPQEKPKEEEDDIASSAAATHAADEDLDKTIEEGEVRDDED